MASVELPYNFAPREYQKPLWNALIRDGVKRAVTVWPRRNGKDIMAVNVLIAMAMQRVGTYYYIGPYYKQIREIIWQGIDGNGHRFLDYIPKALIKNKQDQEMRIFLVNGSVIKLCGSDNVDAIVGSNPIGIIFTEFSLHRPEAWHYLRPILAENGGWALFNGTPRGLNHYYQMCEAAQADSTWFYQYLTRDDTGIPSLEAIAEDRRSGMPESLIQQEYYCSWSASSENTLIPLDLVKPCTSTQLDQSAFVGKARVMGVDVAFAAKGDEATIGKRQGRYVQPILSYQGLDNMEFASRVADQIQSWKPRAVFIDAGRGEGVISRLEQLGFSDVIVPVNFGGTPSIDLYANKKSEMWFRMRNWFMEENPPLIPYDEKLITDLTAPTFTMDEKHRFMMESKKALKKRGFSSTDRGDCIALTFAEEVFEEVLSPTEIMLEEMFPGLIEKQHKYDPLNYMNARD
jgi:hypothetical protein